MLLIFFAITILFLPHFLSKLSKLLSFNKWVSDIVVCYAIGILFGNTKWIWLYSWNNSNESEILMNSFSKDTAGITVILAIPMLLMINNVRDWLKHSGRNSLYFILFSFSVAVICLGCGYFFRYSIENYAVSSGMMTGVYIGGTPNMVAISKALNADESLFALLNATDTLCSAVFFFFMLSIAKPLFKHLLPSFKNNENHLDQSDELKDEQEYPFPPKALTQKTVIPLLKAVGLSLFAISISILPAILIPDSKGELNTTLLILCLTTLGILFSLNIHIRKLPGVYNFAQYLLLIFGFSTGFLADFAQMISEGGNFLIFNAVIAFSILIVHLLLAIIFRIDTDSFIVCSCANVLGPPFIAQTCSAINNRKLIPVGISLGLLGLALANYLGIIVYTLLNNL